MKKETLVYTAPLSREVIDIYSDYVRSFLEEQKIDKRDILRYCMTLEEILLDSIENGNEGAEVQISLGYKLFKPNICLEIGGKANNIYIHENEQHGVLGGSILRNLGLSPEYSYRYGKNIFSFKVNEKKHNPVISYVVITMFFAEVYGVNVSVWWFVVMIFASGILAVATPPMPGGALTAYTVLFTQLGIPAEALAIALACDAIIDFVCTGGDQFLLPFVLLNRADKLGMVDRKILKKK